MLGMNMSITMMFGRKFRAASSASMPSRASTTWKPADCSTMDMMSRASS